MSAPRPPITLPIPAALTLALALTTLGVLSLSLLLSVRLPLATFLDWTLAGSLLLGALLAGLTAVAAFGHRLPREVSLPSPTGRLLAVLSLSLSLYAFVPTGVAAGAALVLMALAAVDLRRFGGRGLPYLLAAAATWLALYAVLHEPLDPLRSDVLPSIEAAGRYLLDGRDPYLAEYGHITHNPFFYLPVQIGVYLPAVAAGVDPRWLNVLLAGGAPLLVHLALGRRGDAEPLYLLYWPVALSPVAFAQAQSGQVQIYWLTIAAIAVCLLRSRWLLAAVALGVALATRQTGVLLAAALAVALPSRLPRRTYLWALALSLGVCLSTLLPFYLRSHDFFGAVFFDRPASALRMGISRDGNPYNQIALANPLSQWGLAGHLVWLQIAAGLAGLAGLWALRRRGLADVLTLAGLMYMAVVTVRMVAHLYYYFPGLMLIAFGISAAAAGPLRRREEQSSLGASP